jgi:hypothetical protein
MTQQTLQAYLRGEDVPHDRLATAIGLLMQSHDAACERVWSLTQALARTRRPTLHRPPSPRRRPALPKTGDKTGWQKRGG